MFPLQEFQVNTGGRNFTGTIPLTWPSHIQVSSSRLLHLQPKFTDIVCLGGFCRLQVVTSSILRPPNWVRKSMSLLGTKKKHEREPQMRNPSSCEGQTCSKCNMYREHQHYCVQKKSMSQVHFQMPS